MTFRSALFCGVAFCPLAMPAVAQVTADDVWQNQSGYLSSLGFVTEATPVRDGSTVTMTDVRMVWTVPMGFGEVTISSPDVTMVENADGTVAISYPDKFRLNLRANLTIEGETGTVGADIGVRLDGQNLVASGTPGAVTYAARTALMDVKLDRIVLEGAAGGGNDIPPINMILTLNDLTTDTTITDGADAHTITATTSAGQTIFELSFDDGYGTVTTTVGSVESTTSTANLVVPTTPVDWLNLTTALRSGLSVDVTSGATGSRQQTVVSMDGNRFSDQSQTVETSTQSLRLDATGLAIEGGARNLAVDLEQPMVMPFPINVTIADGSGSFRIPLLADTNPQPYLLAMGIQGLTVSDALWGMVDAGGVLPRDPANLGFTLSGQVINKVDMFDIMGWEAFAQSLDSGKPPFDLVSLDITGLDVSAIGARLTGEGAFTIDNSDLTTFDGLPRPEGQATARLTGLYGAIDKLSQIGILPMEAGMGARAAIGMFAQATGPDELTSNIVVGPGASVTINGMPIPLP